MNGAGAQNEPGGGGKGWFETRRSENMLPQTGLLQLEVTYKIHNTGAQKSMTKFQ